MMQSGADACAEFYRLAASLHALHREGLAKAAQLPALGAEALAAQLESESDEVHTGRGEGWAVELWAACGLLATGGVTWHGGVHVGA